MSYNTHYSVAFVDINGSLSGTTPTSRTLKTLRNINPIYSTVIILKFLTSSHIHNLPSWDSHSTS